MERLLLLRSLTSRRGFLGTAGVVSLALASPPTLAATPAEAAPMHNENVRLDEADPHGSPLGSKGIGELGICGAGAAIMNAIHNATGARIRDFPATPDKLLAALETLDG